MPDDRLQQDLNDLALNRFWNELVRPAGDPDATVADLDPELAETVRRLRALAQTPPPAPARERVRHGLSEQLGTHRNGKETTMLQTGTLTLSGSRFGPTGRTYPHVTRTRTARSGVRWLSVQFATAALLLVTLSGVYLSFGGPRPWSRGDEAIGSLAPFPEAGEPVGFVWARTGDAQHQLGPAVYVAIDPVGRVWVISSPGTFFIFDPDGTLLEIWGTPGEGEGQFDFHDASGIGAGAILFAPDGGFYVADFANRRVQRFDEDRQFIRAWGTPGSGDGQFLGPVGLAFDAEGNVLVSDFYRNDVQRFTPEGSFLDTFGVPDAGHLAHISVAPDGGIWVVDYGAHRVYVFGPDRSFRFAFGGWGRGHGLLTRPTQVAFDAAGHAFVADERNDLVQVFDLTGRFLYQFGGLGLGEGQFSGLTSVAVDREGAVYVTEWNNRRVQKFAIVGPFPPPAEAPPAP